MPMGVSAALWFLGYSVGSIAELSAFTSSCCLHRQTNGQHESRSGLFRSKSPGVAEGIDEGAIRVGDLLSDLPTPALLIELSLAENTLNGTTVANLDGALRNRGETAALDGSVFVHTQVTDTSVRDDFNRDLGSGKSPVIGRVDASSEQHLPGGAFLGIGLSNHHVGGYYWARGMGIGASLEAHGVAFRDATSEITDVSKGGGELYWKKRGADPTTNTGSALSRGATTEESSNSNDGKRSEWADFLVRGDTVQLIPYNATRVLRESMFERLVGVRRVGRPLGADPIVEKIWKRGPSEEEGSGRDTWIPF